jgi:hypothetical protein
MSHAHVEIGGQEADAVGNLVRAHLEGAPEVDEEPIRSLTVSRPAESGRREPSATPGARELAHQVEDLRENLASRAVGAHFDPERTDNLALGWIGAVEQVLPGLFVPTLDRCAASEGLVRRWREALRAPGGPG